MKYRQRNLKTNEAKPVASINLARQEYTTEDHKVFSFNNPAYALERATGITCSESGQDLYAGDRVFAQCPTWYVKGNYTIHEGPGGFYLISEEGAKDDGLVLAHWTNQYTQEGYYICLI